MTVKSNKMWLIFLIDFKRVSLPFFYIILTQKILACHKNFSSRNPTSAPHPKAILQGWVEVLLDSLQEAILVLHKSPTMVKLFKANSKKPQMFNISSTTGKGTQEPYSLKTPLIKRIAKQKKRMIFVREKWTSEGPNSVKKR